MESYENFTVREFVLDEHFQRWVQFGENPAFWEQWVSEHPQCRETVAEARETVLLLYQDEDELDPVEINAMWQLIKFRRQSETAPVYAPGWRNWQRAAAVITLLLAAAGSFYFFQVFRPQPLVYQATHQPRTLTLPDGSSVVLNAHSRLTLTPGWNEQQSREVWLEGEAYFEVSRAKNARNTFVVHASGLNVRVLGTTFNVWQRQRQTKIVLSSGKIRLDGETITQPVVMTPGEIVELTGQPSRPVPRRVDARVYTSWKDNRLIFVETPLSEVARVIQTRYGYNVQVTDSTVLTEQITFKPLTDDFQVLLRMLSESFQVEVDPAARQITIRGNSPK